MLWNHKHATRILAESEQRLDAALEELNKALPRDSASLTAALEAQSQVARTSGALNAASRFMAEDREDLVKLLDACHTLTWWIDQHDNWTEESLTEEELEEFWRLARNARRMVAMACVGIQHEPVLRDLTVREEEDAA